MCAVCADAHDVLQDNLVIVLIIGQLLAVVLETNTGKLAIRPVHHAGGRPRVMAAIVQGAADKTSRSIASIKLAVSRPDTPLRKKFVYALRIPAALMVVIRHDTRSGVLINLYCPGPITSRFV